MKRKYELTAFIFGLITVLISLNPGTAKAQYDDDVSLETFYDELSPYGVWIDDPQYGRVWRPDVDQDEFRPYYSSGHWEMTRYGNTWVSDYDWGWAPFHYGRWHHQSRRGWVWIPGTTWGPAWVSWRSGGGHYGWAPLGPGINININIGRIPDFYWVFVPQRSIYYNSYPRYDRRRNYSIYQNTVIINNVYVNNRNRYYTGPRADEIRRVTRQPVTIHQVRNEGPRYANNRSNRQEVNRSSERPVVNQSPRPTRSGDNSSGRNVVTGRPDNNVVDRTNRGAVNGRPDNNVSARPSEQAVSRPGQQQLPARSQRSTRTYDNQDIGNTESAQRERQQIMENQRRQQASRPSAPEREQRAQQPQQREVSRQQPQQREVSRQQPQRTERSSPERSSSSQRESSPGRSAERSSNSGGRPSRVQ
jgi:uncharacterized protein DUF6600